jgi:hypothetical protein
LASQRNPLSACTKRCVACSIVLLCLCAYSSKTKRLRNVNLESNASAWTDLKICYKITWPEGLNKCGFISCCFYNVFVLVIPFDVSVSLQGAWGAYKAMGSRLIPILPT